MELIIKEEFILLNYEAQKKEEVIEKLGNILLKEGVVKDTFIKKVLEREKVFPTGLPTEPVKIAIPHTDAEHCNASAIAVATLSKPIKFGLMGDDSKTIDVQIVFLLAINRKEEQCTFLSNFSQFICSADTISKIINAKDTKVVEKILREKLCQ